MLVPKLLIIFLFDYMSSLNEKADMQRKKIDGKFFQELNMKLSREWTTPLLGLNLTLTFSASERLWSSRL